jgi:short-subunit dehydrogenase
MAAFSECLALEVAPFNIKVLTLIPSDMRTAFVSPEKLTSSGAVMPLSKPYEGTIVEFVLSAIKGMHGTQTIDPQKAAERIIQLVLGTGSAEMKKSMATGLTSIPIGVDSGNCRKEKGLLWQNDTDELEEIWASCEVD